VRKTTVGYGVGSWNFMNRDTLRYVCRFGVDHSLFNNIRSCGMATWALGTPGPYATCAVVFPSV